VPKDMEVRPKRDGSYDGSCFGPPTISSGTGHRLPLILARFAPDKWVIA